MADFPNKIYQPRKKEAPKHSVPGVEIRGSVGAPSMYGTRKYGAFHYGAGAETHGIYQVRTRFGRRTQVKMAHYWPTNRQTEPQQAWRAIFKDGVDAWNLLNEAEREDYNKEAKNLPLYGFNLFIRKYLNEHK